GRLGHHRLDEAGAVADDEEMDLSARAAIVEPALERHLFTFVLADVLYVDVSHRSIIARAALARARYSFVDPRHCPSNTSAPSYPTFWTVVITDAHSMLPSSCRPAATRCSPTISIASTRSRSRAARAKSRALT